MKKTSLGLAGLALLCVTPALADNTDTATVTVSGTIVAPLTIAAGTLTMPHVVKPKATLTAGGASPSTGTSTVSVTCDSAGVATIAYGAGANPFADGTASAATVSGSSANTAPAVSGTGSTATCASMAVTGQANYFFLTTTAAGTGFPAGVNATATTCSPGSSNVQLNGSGTATIYCGAAIAVTTSASTGAYTGSFPVTVTYD